MEKLKLEKEKMITITIQLPESKHTKFKVICAILGIRMKKFVVTKIDELIEEKKDLFNKLNGD